MVKLLLLLALALSTALVDSLPARELKNSAEVLDERAITLSSNIDVTTSYTSTLESLQTVTATVSPSVTGTFLTALPTDGITKDPLAPSVTKTPGGSLAPIDSTLAPGPTAPAGPINANIFVPMAQDDVPPQIQKRGDHIVKKLNIQDEDVPIETNKFYANLFLGSQSQSIWTNPYSLTWAKGHGETWGMAVTHVERSQLAWDDGEPPRYFIGPVGLQHIVFSAAELGEQTTLYTDELKAFSVYANLAPSPGAEPIISMPCVQGMGFVTAVYNNAKPQLNSGTFFRTLEYVDQLNGITFKYRIVLEDDSQWLLYATPVASLGTPPFELKDSATIEGPEGFIGMIQVAKNPANSTGEQVYDSTAGAFAVNATLSASVEGNSGTYTLAYGKDGIQNQTLVMFALPHHVESFDDITNAALTDIHLDTITKGVARAVVADKLTMVESDLPTAIGFAPWSASNKAASGNDQTDTITLTAEALTAINSAGALELNEDFTSQTSLDSMYYSGKGLAKFAGIIITLQNLANNTSLAAAGLVKLKDAVNVFVNNTQPLPLVYDTIWKGVVSSGTYAKNDTGLDFGNTLYNDHHFHYGYFVYTAAVIGYLDPTWLQQGTNKAWINMLVRDFANPSPTDPFFPFQRSFDWFNGHSWAKGLFESGDGKDQESTSEDTFATYALKMWGRVSGDANMEARGNLQLAVQARSLQNYFLLSSDNKVQPARFLPNKVTGILFENKIDHTTYFGGKPEFIQGIHMIPLNPSSAYTRPASFVREEWEAYFSNGRVDGVEGGWQGILYANLALVDPQTAYGYFANESFDIKQLDGGASRTWYLAYCAAMMGAGVGPVGADLVQGKTVSVAAVEADGNVNVASVEPESQDEDGTMQMGSDANGFSSDDEDYYSDVEGRSSDDDDEGWYFDTEDRTAEDEYDDDWAWVEDK